MRTTSRGIAALAMLALTSLAAAQVETGKPADATALCKDGTFYSGSDQAAACKTNGGIQEWWGKVVAPKNVPEGKKVPDTSTRDRAREPKNQ
jgi:hypothetical protein